MTIVREGESPRNLGNTWMKFEFLSVGAFPSLLINCPKLNKTRITPITKDPKGEELSLAFTRLATDGAKFLRT